MQVPHKFLPKFSPNLDRSDDMSCHDLFPYALSSLYLLVPGSAAVRQGLSLSLSADPGACPPPGACVPACSGSARPRSSAVEARQASSRQVRSGITRSRCPLTRRKGIRRQNLRRYTRTPKETHQGQSGRTEAGPSTPETPQAKAHRRRGDADPLRRSTPAGAEGRQALALVNPQARQGP